MCINRLGTPRHVGKIRVDTMVLTEAACVGVVVLGLILWIQRWSRLSNLPPGPTPIPFLGNIMDVKDSTLAVDAAKLGKKYGDIITVYMFMTPNVILNSYEATRDLLWSSEYADIFSGREASFMKTDLFPDNLIFQSPSESHKYLRNVVMRGVKQYGTALKKIEKLAHAELKDLIDKIKGRDGLAYDIMQDIDIYVTNIMMILVCGERFEGDHRMIKIAHEVAADFDFLMNAKIRILLNKLPFARHLYPPLKRTIERMRRNNEDYTRYLTEMRQEAIRGHPDCLFALLKDEMDNGYITRNNVQGVSLDMLLAGVLTTTPTFYATILAISHFPAVQKRAREEILDVVGSDRLPGLDDKQNLPYCHATMLEAFRYLTPVPLPGPRTTMKDCTYKGYFFPKDTMVVYNVYNVHHDEDFWEKPFEFDPTRFLDSEGNLLPPENERRMRLLTFGVGKRDCVGETLARLRIFLAMTAILQKFELKEDPDHPLPSADQRTYYMNLLTIPPPYKLRFVPRESK